MNSDEISKKLSGGQLLVKYLEQQGVKRIFCVPGESYLPVLDALHDSEIDSIVCRQEGGAAMMAEATGKLTGEPGICFVTRGPGATNASAGLHVARQDSTPMILFVGQINSGQRHREAFQEIDYQQFFGGIAKWVAEIDAPERMAEMVSRAWHVATAGRPGPVVLVLPEDTLSNTATINPMRAWTSVEPSPSETRIKHLSALLRAAKSPVAILGGSRWSREAVDRFTQFAEKFDLPVACSFRRQMLFDNTHPNYAGDVGLAINPQLHKRINDADLLLVVGARLPEIASQNYTLLNIPVPEQRLIHIHPGAEELGKTYHPALAIQASPTAFCGSLASLNAPESINWAGAASDAHNSFLEWTSLSNAIPEGALMAAVMQSLEDSLTDDAILCNGAGNYAGWIHRFWKFKQYGTQVAPTSGSMGYGLPGAIAAKLNHPERTVIAFAGDGCFQMTSQELGTAVQAGANIIILVVDNGMYGTIRMHQEMHFPGRVSSTDLINPDFAAIARAYGVSGVTVSEPEDFDSVFNEALTSKKLALLHLKLNPNAITPTSSLNPG